MKAKPSSTHLAVLGSRQVTTATFRKNYAGIGYSYWPDLDAFVAPKCHDEAVLDEATCLWICNNEEHTTREIN
jgi:hypothetical protein